MKKKIIYFVASILLITSCSTAWTQPYYRIKADFSIKIKTHDNRQQLTMGTAYYDRNIRKIVYLTNFPVTETWVSLDTILYKIATNALTGKQDVVTQRIPAIAEFSIFHLCLNGQLADYGLKKSTFRVSAVEIDGEQVITTWTPPAKYAKYFGQIIVSNKGKRLFGIVFMNPAGVVLSKQFFTKYENFNGLEFPTEIIQITYLKEGEDKQITSYRNIQINDRSNDEIYNFKLPTH